MEHQSHEIFVPGRLCVLGEHSDWAGQYRYQNPAVSVGSTIVCSTNEGLYAKCSTYHSNTVKFVSTNNYGVTTCLEATLDAASLNVGALTHDFFSYIRGTISAVLTWPSIQNRISEILCKGIDINNYRSTLPMKKGLSSSAAVCVMVATCFNQLFSLDLSRDEIMELAFQGEMHTPSRCGRMDQCVAMGSGSIALMEFNNDHCSLRLLACRIPLYFVVADLKASKNTVAILRDLSACFPIPKSCTQYKMHEYVTGIRKICWDAVAAIEGGDTTKLGLLMTTGQSLFDECAMPNCPDFLTSPRLHEVINNFKLREVSLGAKGVGSQGDGSVQVLCKSEKEQLQVFKLLEELGCDPFVLTVPSSPTSIERPLISSTRIKSALLLLNTEDYKHFRYMNSLAHPSLLSVSYPDGIRSILFGLCQECIANDIDDITVFIYNHPNQFERVQFYKAAIITALQRTSKHVVADSPTSEWNYADKVQALTYSKCNITPSKNHSNQSFQAFYQLMETITEKGFNQKKRKFSFDDTSTFTSRIVNDEYILILNASTIIRTHNGFNRDTGLHVIQNHIMVARAEHYLQQVQAGFKPTLKGYVYYNGNIGPNVNQISESSTSNNGSYGSQGLILNSSIVALPITCFQTSFDSYSCDDSNSDCRIDSSFVDDIIKAALQSCDSRAEILINDMIIVSDDHSFSRAVEK